MNFPKNKYYLVTKGLIEARKIYAIIRKDEYDKIAAELQDLLVRSWNEATTEAIRDVIRATNNRLAFTNEMLDEMIAALKPKLGAAFAGNVANTMLEIQASTYSLGMKDILGISPSLNLVDNKALEALARYANYPVMHHFDAQLEGKIREFGSKIISEGLNREEAGKLFEDEFAKKYDLQSFRYWQGYANHVVTDTRESGRISAYEQAEVEYAEVRAILDHRTTEICRHMHGRRILVSELRRVEDIKLANPDPSKIKDIMPWASAKSVSESKTTKLPDGALKPPYHFNCRTRTVMAREVSERNQVSGTSMGKGVGADDKKKLNSLTDEEYSNWMQTIRGKRKFGFAPDQIEEQLKEYASSLGLKTADKDAYLKAGQGIVRNATGVIAKVNNTADGKRQFNFHFFSAAGVAVVGDDLLFHSIKGLEDSAKSFAGSLSNGLKLGGSWDE